MSQLDFEKARKLIKPWDFRRLYHRAEIRNAEKIPSQGSALLVSNHGRLDFDFFILANIILREKGRLIRVMFDHLWYKLPVIKEIVPLTGAVEGTRENAIKLLKNEELVLTYPGGVPEIMNSRFGHEHMDWTGRTGFATVSVATQSPIIPIASIGVNNGFIFLTSGRLLGYLLYQKIFRMGPAYKKYRDPLVIGAIPLPIPFSMAVHFPLPCKIGYIVGEPIYPEVDASESNNKQSVQRLAQRSRNALQDLISKC